MTEVELLAEIKIRLGSNLVDVELVESDFTVIKREMYDWVNSYLAEEKRRTLTLVADETEYSIPADVIDISEVYIPSVNLLKPYTTDVFYTLSWGQYRPWGMRYSGLVQELQHLETVKRILGAEKSWDFLDGTLYLIPSPSEAGVAVYDCTVGTTDIANITRPDVRDIVVDYALACAKEIVGRKLGKFSEYPTAGGTVTVDADKLRDDAKEEKESLTDKISEKALPCMPMWG